MPTSNHEGSRIFDLEQPRYPQAPTHPVHAVPGMQYLLHRRHEADASERRTGASGVFITGDHVGTHIDAPCHQAEAMMLPGGRRVDSRMQTPHGFTELGVETLEPIVTRGLLIDLVRASGVPVQRAAPITRAEVDDARARQGLVIRSGDVVLIRTGAGRFWSAPETYLRAPGMSDEVSQWLADAGVRAVGADNVSWDAPDDVSAATGTSLPGHVILLARRGIPIIENLHLEELGDARADEFTFICLPLKIKGATGSPVRPIAIV